MNRKFVQIGMLVHVIDEADRYTICGEGPVNEYDKQSYAPNGALCAACYQKEHP